MASPILPHLYIFSLNIPSKSAFIKRKRSNVILEKENLCYDICNKIT